MTYYPPRYISRAIEARDALELGRVDVQFLAGLYLDYNSEVGDAVGFCTRGLAGFPRWCCGIASLYLRERLGIGQIWQGSYGAINHSFLLLPNGLIADITADQFGGPEVYVGKLRRPWSISSLKRDGKIWRIVDSAAH